MSPSRFNRKPGELKHGDVIKLADDVTAEVLGVSTLPEYNEALVALIIPIDAMLRVENT